MNKISYNSESTGLQIEEEKKLLTSKSKDFKSRDDYVISGLLKYMLSKTSNPPPTSRHCIDSLNEGFVMQVSYKLK